MLVATFGPSTGWAGKTIAFENKQFILKGHGVITAADIMEYDGQGHLDWEGDTKRDWVRSMATRPPEPVPEPRWQSPFTIGTYSPFSMCPFTQAEIGGGGTIAGFGGYKYTWTHGPCIQHYCRLYTYRFDEDGEPQAEGCSLQFLGMSADQIRLDAQMKRRRANDILGA